MKIVITFRPAILTPLIEVLPLISSSKPMLGKQ